LAGIEIVYDFSSEDAGFRAAVSTPGGLNLIPSERDRHDFGILAVSSPSAP